MDTLKEITYQVVSGYAGEGLNGISYLTQNADGTVLTVTDFAQVQGKHITGISLVVRLIGNFVVIERDQNDKPLVDALLEAGILRSQIVLAYAGEPAPEAL
ncbi:MAG: XisI protein [Anaerolineae bacterium]|nr:XisI protein [Anaerolineae bacterium]